MSRKKTNVAQPVAQLPVGDIEQAQGYYQKVLGFDIAWTYPDKTIGAVSRGDAAIFFAKNIEPVTPSVHWIFAPTLISLIRNSKNQVPFAFVSFLPLLYNVMKHFHKTDRR